MIPFCDDFHPCVFTKKIFYIHKEKLCVQLEYTISFICFCQQSFQAFLLEGDGKREEAITPQVITYSLLLLSELMQKEQLHFSTKELD